MKAEKNPTVSVIIPTYNRAHLVGRAIQSGLNQTYQDFEIIVVDDGSTDNTEEVVKSFNDPRIRYIMHEKNRGGSAARNTGVRAARGKYIAFLDSDDEWLPHKLWKQVEAFENLPADFGLIYTRVCYKNPEGRVTYGPLPRAYGFVFPQLLKGNVIGTCSSVIVKQKVFSKVGLFDEHLPARQDLDMWLRISRHYKVFPLREVLTVCYVHEERITSNIEAKVIAHEIFLRKYLQDLSKHPRAYSWQLYGLGMLYLQKGEVRQAKKFLLESIKQWPYPIVVLKFITLLGGKTTYDFFVKVKKWI